MLKYFYLYMVEMGIDSLLTSRRATRQKWGTGNSCKLLFGSGVAAPIERKLEEGKLTPLPRKWWLNNGHPCPWWIHDLSAVFPLLVWDSWSIAGPLPSHLQRQTSVFTPFLTNCRGNWISHCDWTKLQFCLLWFKIYSLKSLWKIIGWYLTGNIPVAVLASKQRTRLT